MTYVIRVSDERRWWKNTWIKIGVSTVAPLWRDLVIILRCKSRQRYWRPNFERPGARKQIYKIWSSTELPTYPVCRDQTDRSSGLTNLTNTTEGFWKNLDRFFESIKWSPSNKQCRDGLLENQNNTWRIFKAKWFLENQNNTWRIFKWKWFLENLNSTWRIF